MKGTDQDRGKKRKHNTKSNNDFEIKSKKRTTIQCYIQVGAARGLYWGFPLGVMYFPGFNKDER